LLTVLLAAEHWVVLFPA